LRTAQRGDGARTRRGGCAGPFQAEDTGGDRRRQPIDGGKNADCRAQAKEQKLGFLKRRAFLRVCRKDAK
jgi:hypothetical protein